MQARATRKNTEASYEKAFAALNDRQREAVSALEGPVMVIAGPGTGKTQMLTLRIATILAKTDYPPEAILALTFTESGALAMRKRLADLIGPDAYRVSITTFHGFAHNIIQAHADAFPDVIGGRAMTDVEGVDLLSELLQTGEYEALRPSGDPEYYIQHCVRAISELKREGVSPEVFTQIVREDVPGDDEKETSDRMYARRAELVKLYGAYMDACAARRWYDFDDMIIRARDAMMHDSEIAADVRERYQHILIDEHQDTNAAQHGLVDAIIHDDASPNIFVVGDTKQAIYRFQGASHENFHALQRAFKKMRVVTLDTNYRSTQHVLDAAHGLAPQSEPLHAHRALAGIPVRLGVFSHTDVELFGIARIVQSHIADGVASEEIAILVRDNAHAEPIVRALGRAGIRAAHTANQSLFRHPRMRSLLLLFRTACNAGDQYALAEALQAGAGKCDVIDVFRFLRSLRSGQDAWNLIRSESALRDVGIVHPKLFLELAAHIIKAHEHGRQHGPLALLDLLIPLIDLFDSPEDMTDMRALRTLYAAVRGVVARSPDIPLDAVWHALVRAHDHGALALPVHALPVGYVRVMTAHRAKGLEFKVVIIAHAVDGTWGGKQRRELLTLPEKVYRITDAVSQDPESDERNVFYVALTRAQDVAYITYSVRDLEDRERLPSRFITELHPAHLETFPVDAFEAAYLTTYATQAAVPQPPADVHAYVKDLFLTSGLSVTALNNYLSCPWKFFFRNLVRMPEAPHAHAQLGTAIHAALRAYGEAFTHTGEHVPTIARATFIKALEHEPLTMRDRKRLEERGLEMVDGYLTERASLWRRDALYELRISDVPAHEGIVLHGALDKLEKLSPTEAHVLDYKTGAFKTRNALLGKTKDATGDEARQLAFYSILLQGYQGGALQMTSGQIEYIQPDTREKYRGESFTLNELPVAETKEAIKKVISEVLALSFWDKKCDDRECTYCTMRFGV
ncbi:MAG: ATP-dependent DNA helicase [Patescibacteria group bacterium]